MSIFLELSPGLSFVIICAITVAMAVLGLHLVRGKYKPEILKENHEVAAIIFNAFGLLYAVVVAFVVFVVWGRYDDAGKNIELEASQASDLFYVSKGFPDSINKPIRQALYDYASSVSTEEYQDLPKGKTSAKTLDAVKRLMALFSKMDIKAIPNPYIYEESFKGLNNMLQYRRLRVFAAQDSVPAVIWVVLLVGGIITVTYTYFFGVKKIFPQYVMTAALTITLTLILFLVFILDHPFTGTSSVGISSMKTVSDGMKKGVEADNTPPSIPK